MDRPSPPTPPSDSPPADAARPDDEAAPSTDAGPPTLPAPEPAPETAATAPTPPSSAPAPASSPTPPSAAARRTAVARPSMPARREKGDVLLDEFIASHHVYCPSCRTELRGLSGRRCPSCRQSLVLRVALERPNLGAYLTGLTALLIAAALNAYLAFHFVLEVARLGMTDDRPAYVIVSVAGAIVTALALVIWIVVGRRFRRLGFLPRWVAAALIWVLPVGSFIAIVRLFGPW